MVVLQNILLKKKTNPYLKYFLNHKILFCLSDFAKHLEKPLILQKNRMAQSQTLICFVTIATILKSSFLLVFFNLNVANFKNLRLLLNRYQSLCQKAQAQKGFVCVLIKLLYKACSSMLYLKMVH